MIKVYKDIDSLFYREIILCKNPINVSFNV